MLDPTSRNAAFRLANRIPGNKFGLHLFHAMSVAGSIQRPKLAHVRIISIPSASGGHIKVWIVTPKSMSGPLPVVLHLHGGGLAIGVPSQDYSLFDTYIARRPAIFVAPQYRRSIHSPYPAGLDDCFDTLCWLRDNAGQLGGRDDQIFTMGESAGGCLAAAVGIKARDTSHVNIAAQFLNYAMLDDRAENWTPVDRAKVTWSHDHNLLAWKIYLAGWPPDQTVPHTAAPARANDLSNLPPTYGFIGDQDIFFDENQDFFDRLDASGVITRFQAFKGAYHAAETFAPRSEVGREMWAFALDSFDEACETRFTAQS